MFIQDSLFLIGKPLRKELALPVKKFWVK